jgi:hypothetical protein
VQTLFVITLGVFRSTSRCLLSVVNIELEWVCTALLGALAVINISSALLEARKESICVSLRERERS